MSVRQYIKERWYMFVFFVAASFFSAAVCLLDKDSLFENTSAAYILSGIALFFVGFVISDYLIFRHRVKTMISFIKTGGQEETEFTYPSDILFSGQITRLTQEYNAYRERISGEAAEDLDFVTKWIHDVKVPISAMKLLLETDADSLKERLEMELMSIEQNTQKVLFNIKSKSLYDDYNISETDVKDIVNASLKQFAVFFAFKKIGLKMNVGNYAVLTDRKWSVYIISQFLSNAVKNTQNGGDIEINTEKKDGCITVSVTNTGSGIPKRDLSRVFDRGYTSAGRHNPNATGYGLYLSKKLAGKLGHTVEAQSKEGEYAKFSLVLKQKKSPM